MFSLTLCIILPSPDFFQNSGFQKFLSGIDQSAKQFRSGHTLSGLILLQTVCKDFYQMSIAVEVNMGESSKLSQS